MPVVGAVHDDAEHIRADFQHIHVDCRFLCQRDRRRLLHQREENPRIPRHLHLARCSSRPYHLLT